MDRVSSRKADRSSSPLPWHHSTPESPAWCDIHHICNRLFSLKNIVFLIQHSWQLTPTVQSLLPTYVFADVGHLSFVLLFWPTERKSVHREGVKSTLDP